MIIQLSNKLQWLLPSPYGNSLLLLLLLTLSITLWLVYRRITLTKLTRLSLVMLLNMMAMIAVLGLISEFRWLSHSVQKAILFTSGADKTLIHGVQKYKDAQWFVMSELDDELNSTATPSAIDGEFNDAIRLISTQQLNVLMPDLQHIIVYGDGLTDEQWLDFDDVLVEFIPSVQHIGPINLSWRKHLSVGQYLEVHGDLQSTQKNKMYQVALYDLVDQQVDTKIIKAGESFTLKATTKALGQYVYRLKVTDVNNAELISDEQVAFEVISANLPSLIVKQSAPSFESRFLKNWASEQGAKMLLMTQISKDKSVKQRLNFSEHSVVKNNETNTDKSLTPFDNDNSLSVKYLANYDVLILDGRSLLILSQNEQEQIQQSVNAGLGLLILADNELIQARQQTASLLLASFILEPSKGDVINKTIPSWPNSDVRDAVNYYPGSVDIINAQVLVKGDKNQPLVINRQAGLGNIALSFIHDSYQWKTLGKSLQYGQYWQYIINAIARNQSEPYWLEQNPASLVYRHQQNRSCAMSGDMDLSARQSVVHTAEQPMMLVPSILQPSLRCGFFWSDYVGWQKFTLLNHKEQPIDSQSAYVYAENAWSTWLQAKKYQASMNKTKEQVSITIKPQYKSLDRWYFWLVLFTCSSLLWIEKKVFNKT